MINIPKFQTIKKQEHSFGEVSILIMDEDKRKRLTTGGVSTEELVRNIQQLADEGIFAVCRIDPIIPCVTNDEAGLEALV